MGPPPERGVVQVLCSYARQGGLERTRADRCGKSPFSPWIGNSKNEKGCASPTRTKGTYLRYILGFLELLGL
jgi:hypothetical protein